MTKAYIPTNGTLAELKTVINTVQQLGLDKQHTYIGGSFDAFTQNLAKGDTALVYSLSLFNSITEILAKTTELHEREITLNSINEPWFNNPDTTSQVLLTQLFKLSSSIHAPRSAACSTAPTKNRSLVVEKVRNAKRLTDEHRIPVAQACKLSHCSLSAYYTHVKKLDQ